MQEHNIFQVCAGNCAGDELQFCTACPLCVWMLPLVSTFLLVISPPCWPCAGCNSTDFSPCLLPVPAHTTSLLMASTAPLPVPTCAWARGCTAALTGWGNWRSATAGSKRCTTPTKTTWGVSDSGQATSRPFIVPKTGDPLATSLEEVWGAPWCECCTVSWASASAVTLKCGSVQDLQEPR